VVELPLVEPTERDDEDDLSAATPEAASALTLTGEHQALDLSASAGDGGGGGEQLHALVIRRGDRLYCLKP
jgi:hypothetical protein